MLGVLTFIRDYNPTSVCIEEIIIRTVFRYCHEYCKVKGNEEDTQHDGIVILTLNQKGIKI